MVSKKVLLAASLFAVLLFVFAAIYEAGQMEVASHVKSLYENLTVNIENPLEVATKSLYESQPTSIEDPHPWVS